MLKSGKSSSIASSFSTLLLEAWEKWDTRGMALFSLILQIFLYVFGSCRKYSNSPFSKTILWFAYLGADWVAIATLGKLSNTFVGSPTTNVLRAYWAPLLLLHLGGPDTITAYAFEDNNLWVRHLLTLIVKAILVIYVICLSWTSSWISFLNIPLILAGIIKYVERILCLKWNSSQKIKPVISNIFNRRGHHQSIDVLLKEDPILWQGYLLFAIMRPDVNEYLNLSSTEIRLGTYLEESTGMGASEAWEFIIQYIRLDPVNAFEVFAAELGFIFDVLYTKAALIYTKLGCFFRYTSFVNSFLVLLLFFVTIINEPKFHFSRVDIIITGVLLSGAFALELYAAWVMLSSDWAILVSEFHDSVLVRKVFKAALKCFPRLLRQNKRWSNSMGQFDLLESCWQYKKRKANKSCFILKRIIDYCEITEMWHKNWFPKFAPLPDHFKNFLTDKRFTKLLHLGRGLSYQASRGQDALANWNHGRLIWSIDMDFDYSIIIWHIATSVCYLQEGLDSPNEFMETSKLVSGYMMYVLVTCPALILPEHSKSFWLDHTYKELKKLVSSATDIRNAASELFNQDDGEQEDLESSCNEKTLTGLREYVKCLATYLMKVDHKWEMIKEVWIEMLVYAAVSNQHISHVKQLGEGIGLLSLIWLYRISPDFL